MKRVFLPLLLIAAMIACEEEKENPYKWSDGQIGKITKSTQAYELDSLYPNDSIVKPGPNDYNGDAGKVKLYENDGTLLLTLTPENKGDSTSVFTNIRIHDNRFANDKKINLSSTFKEISTNYDISSMERFGNSVIIRLEDEEFYFVIDAEDLKNGGAPGRDEQVDSTLIPDSAQPKYMYIRW